jgi:Fe-S-cluster containining protein
MLTEAELNTIAEHYHETPGELIRKYYMTWKNKIYILPVREGRSCPFLSKLRGAGAPISCTIYDIRPMHCRTYPAWDNILRTEADWNEQGKFCPGINKGPVSRHIEGIKKLRTVSEDEKLLVTAIRDCFLTHKPGPDGICRSKTCLFHQVRGTEIDKHGCKMYINVKEIENNQGGEKEQDSKKE